MRIWDIKPEKLCRKHLLGEHRELHAIWTILTTGKKGYLNHPETKRWIGKLAALYNRHELEIAELEKRGYIHSSMLNKSLANGLKTQQEYVNSIKEQEELLRKKGCDCSV